MSKLFESSISRFYDIMTHIFIEKKRRRIILSEVRKRGPYDECSKKDLLGA